MENEHRILYDDEWLPAVQGAFAIMVQACKLRGRLQHEAFVQAMSDLILICRMAADDGMESGDEPLNYIVQFENGRLVSNAIWRFGECQRMRRFVNPDGSQIPGHGEVVIGRNAGDDRDDCSGRGECET